MSITCPWADHHITVSSSGTISTCCMSVPVIDSRSGQPYNIKTHTISQAFNSLEFDSIRTNLRNNVKDNNCDSCWKVEEAGNRSLRMDTTDKYRDFFKSKNMSGLLTAQFDLSNQCNLKCRTCNSGDSSMWITEQYDLYERDKGISLNDFQKTFNITLHKEHEFLEDLKINVIPNLSALTFQGGEPFLMKQQWNIIDSIIDAGVAQNITLGYHTNGTIWNDVIAGKLSKFYQVKLCLSIDDIGERFEFLRHPAKWQEVENNINSIIRWYTDNSETRSILINSVVTPCNLYTIHEFLDYFISKNIPVKLHPTNFPDYFSISNIPHSLKSAFLENLNSKKLPDTYQDEINNLVSVLMNTDKPELWKTFLKTTELHDTYRNEDYKKTFPEFYSIINQHDK